MRRVISDFHRLGRRQVRTSLTRHHECVNVTLRYYRDFPSFKATEHSLLGRWVERIRFKRLRFQCCSLIIAIRERWLIIQPKATEQIAPCRSTRVTSLGLYIYFLQQHTKIGQRNMKYSITVLLWSALAVIVFTRYVLM